MNQTAKTKEEIIEETLGYIKASYDFGQFDKAEAKLDEALTAYRQSVLEEVSKLVEENRKGAFTDDGGNDCWYKDCLIDAINHLKQL